MSAYIYNPKNAGDMMKKRVQTSGWLCGFIVSAVGIFWSNVFFIARLFAPRGSVKVQGIQGFDLLNLRRWPR